MEITLLTIQRSVVEYLVMDEVLWLLFKYPSGNTDMAELDFR